MYLVYIINFLCILWRRVLPYLTHSWNKIPYSQSCSFFILWRDW